MKQKILFLNKFLLKRTIINISSALCVLLLYIFIAPHVAPHALATGITVSNVTFEPFTGDIAFDYTGDNLSGTSLYVTLYNTTKTIGYWISSSTSNCTSSHCTAAVALQKDDSSITSVILHIGGGMISDDSQTLTYPLPLPSGVYHGTITSVIAGTGLTGGATQGDATLALANAGVTTVILADGAVTTAKLADASVTTAKIADGAVTAAKLDASASETFYTLSLSSRAFTTTNTTVTFGSINLPVASNVCVMSEWILQNNSGGKGIKPTLVVDGSLDAIYDDDIPLSAAGVGFSISRNHCISNMSAGSHSFGVKIDQWGGLSGEEVGIIEGSLMWINALPVR